MLKLLELEKEFFTLVEDGDVKLVQLFFNDHPNFNVNVMNFQGLTGLHVAVYEKNQRMVDYLLSREAEPYDAHLYAILNNDEKIATMILDKLNELGLEFAGAPRESTGFPVDATPLAVAASAGHFELIGLLIARDPRHRLVKPHLPYCHCDTCKSEKEKDHLTYDQTRLFLYKAISNPAYICQISDDPILEAFQLSEEFLRAAGHDRKFDRDYKLLAQKLSKFATDLISRARTIDEVESLLKRKKGYSSSPEFPYPRLLLALDRRQKFFVAHSNVQQLVTKQWIGEWYEWKGRKIWRRMTIVLLRIPLLPIIVLTVILLPNSRSTKSWSTPVNKFISSLASYLLFLWITFAVSNIDKRQQLRGPPDTGHETILVVFVIGYAWSVVRLCLMLGLKRFFRASWNCYEFATLSAYLLSILFWIAAAIDVELHGQRELERKYWHEYDPTLVAEGIFTLATIMAFFRLTMICQLDYHLGPLQLSLGKMIHDVGKFLVVFVIIIVAFAAGLCRLYNYYDQMVQIDDETKITIQQISSFVDFFSTLKTLFWAIFCMSPIESADVVIENLPGTGDGRSVVNRHSFTQTVGYIAFAGFEFITVVIVLNMLIACMTNTFTTVTDNVTVEWIFGRTEVYVDYMLQTTLPPPFNLIPTYAGIKSLLRYLKICFSSAGDKRVGWNCDDCFYIEDIDKEDEEQFQMVMHRLMQRYFRQKNQEKEENSDIEGLRKDLKELKKALKDALLVTDC